MLIRNDSNTHCMKSVQIRSNFWSVFFHIRIEYGVDTSYISVFSPNARKYGPEITPYLETFHTVTNTEASSEFLIILIIKINYVVVTMRCTWQTKPQWQPKGKRSWNIQNFEYLKHLNPYVEFANRKHHICHVRSQQWLPLKVAISSCSSKTWFISISGKFHHLKCKPNIIIRFLPGWIGIEVADHLK